MLHSIVNVAVAVIHHKQQYLLGFRNSSQHQGDRYEFVGGKIDDDETPRQALIREVREEIGLDLSVINSTPVDLTIGQPPKMDTAALPQYTKDNDLSTQDISTINKLGRITHDYGDKTVILHVFRVSLDNAQFAQWQDVSIGVEGQPLKWVDKQALVAGEYPLPKANITILKWLSLAEHITITRPINDSSDKVSYALNKPSIDKQSNANDALSNAHHSWLDYHKNHLSDNATVYLRHKLSSNTHSQTVVGLIVNLAIARPDLKFVVGCEDYNTLKRHSDNDEIANDEMILQRIGTQHLTQSKLLTLVDILIPYCGQLNNEAVINPSLTYQTLTSDNEQRKLESNSREQQALNNIRTELSRTLAPDVAITASCHDDKSVKAINTLAKVCQLTQFSSVVGAFLSPINRTSSHPDTTALGWRQFNEIAEKSDVPVIALGGLNPDDLVNVRLYGGDKVAGIRHFMKE